MRIVHIAPDFYPVPPQNYGGIERMIYSLIEESVKRGHEVYLYAREGSVTGAKLIAYQHPPGHPESIAEFVLNTLPDKVDVIHDHTHLSIIGRKRLDVPTICTIHDSLNNEIEHPVYVSYRALDVIGKNKGYFVYNGIEVKDYPLQDKKEDYLLFLGVLSPHKGIQQALDVAEKSKVRLIIAGPVFNHEYFRDEIEPRIQAMPHVEYVGEVGGAYRLQLLQHAKCLVFPTSWEEPFGLVMIEAMACGTPVLAFANGAVPEVLKGYPSLICESVDQMLEKLQNLHYEGAQLRSYVENYFSNEKMADGYFDVYEKAIQRHKEKADTKGWFQKGEQLKNGMRYEEANSLYDQILLSDASKEDKIAACNEAADVCYRQGKMEKEREYAFQSFLFAPPRAEICCRLGYQFLQQNQMDQAIFWYCQATAAKHPQEPTKLYYEACWTWLPHIQLCICYFQLGDYEKSYEHNEKARAYDPDNQFVKNNKKMLEELLTKKGESISSVQEIALWNADRQPFKMCLTTPGFIEEMIIKNGNWEPYLAPIIRPFISTDSLFLDIGANIGYHSLHVASLCQDARCISFEPHPVICKQLSANIQINNFSNVKAYPLAIGNREGTTKFYMQNDQSYNRGMSAIDYYEGIGTEYSEIKVDMTTLDEFLNQEDKKKVSVIKIDTQGNEYQVLQGAKKVIAESRPIIAIEHHDNADHSLDDLLMLLDGYQVFKVNLWNGQVTEIEKELDQFQHDYLFIPSHLVKRFIVERTG